MFFELLLNGLAQGSLLALICVGYSLAYGTAKVLNFAHADVMIAGGGYLVLLFVTTPHSSALLPVGMALVFSLAVSVVTWSWSRGFNKSSTARIALTLGGGIIIGGLILGLAGKLPFLVSTILAIPLTASLAAALYQVVYLPLIHRNVPRTSILVASFGASIALESLLLIFWGGQRRVFPLDVLPSFLVARTPPENSGLWVSVFDYGTLPIGSFLQLPVRDILILIVFVVVGLTLALFFRFSRLADAIIATADDRLAARACGVPVDRVLCYAFFLGGAIASLGGTLYVLRAASLDPMSGFTPGVLAFVACVLGGIGSLKGSIAGAFLVGVIMSLAPAIPVDKWVLSVLPHTWAPWLPSLKLGDWSYGVVYVLMIVAILFKPKGLFTR